MLAIAVRLWRVFAGQGEGCFHQTLCQCSHRHTFDFGFASQHTTIRMQHVLAINLPQHCRFLLIQRSAAAGVPPNLAAHAGPGVQRLKCHDQQDPGAAVSCCQNVWRRPFPTVSNEPLDHVLALRTEAGPVDHHPLIGSPKQRPPDAGLHGGLLLTSRL